MILFILLKTPDLVFASHAGSDEICAEPDRRDRVADGDFVHRLTGFWFVDHQFCVFM